MKRQFKSQASSGRLGGFGTSGFGSTQSSALSYIQEPLDYSLIEDANIVVAFKNLNKKDGTTKAKALEDLQNYVLAENGEINQAILEAWVRVFPRLSIDNARRVRQLAHSLTGQLSAKCGKRIAKYLTQLSGPWLAGTFDTDRAAAKAATDSLKMVFPSQDKIDGLRRTFQDSILQYCKDALLNETVQTLSDERAVSADDAEATHARVIATSITVISSLLEHLSDDDISKQSHTYDLVFSDKKLWESAIHPDGSVRKAIHRLVRVALHKRNAFVGDHLKLASNAYIYKGLTSDQTGSAADYAQTLDLLTRSAPKVWTDAYNGKKPAISRLRQCLKNGSYSGPPSFWDALRSVFRNLPSDVLPTSYDEIAELLAAARDGVGKREERLNSSSSWLTYFTILDVAAQPLSDEDCEKLFDAFALPLVRQYVCPQDKSAQWNIAGARAAPTVAQIALVKRIAPLLEKQWQSLADQLIDLAKTSQPEQSKDFDTSQKQVAAAGERWSSLQQELLSEKSGMPDTAIDVFMTANTKILKDATALLNARNGKPYGAAAIIEHQLKASGPRLLAHEDFKTSLIEFLLTGLPALVLSPSQKHLVRCLYTVFPEAESTKAFENALEGILSSQEPEASKVQRLRTLFPVDTPKAAIQLANASSSLQSYLSRLSAGNIDTNTSDLVSALLALGVVRVETSDEILSNLTNRLSLSGPEAQSSLAAFEKLVTSNEQAVKSFMAGPTGAGELLLPSVLRLEQSPDDVLADKASTISNQLTSAMGSAVPGAKYGIILQNLEKISTASLPMDTVLDLVSKVGSDDSQLEELLPNIDTFYNAVVAAVESPMPSLALLSPLGGAVHLSQAEARKSAEASRYDAEGLSQALRIAMYLARVLNRTDQQLSASTDIAFYLALMSVCVLLAEDATSVLGANDLWKREEAQALEHEIMDFVVDANAVLRLHSERLARSLASEQEPLFSSLASLQERAGKGSPLAYYAALAAVKAHQNAFELHGYTTEQTTASADTLKSLRSAKDPLALVSHIVGYSQPMAGSQSLTRVCNELVADITALDVEASEEAALESLVVLNAILYTQEDVTAAVAKNRIIFLVKRVIAWLDTDASLVVQSEICKALIKLIPGMADMYGEHWAQINAWLIAFWRSSATEMADGSVVSETGVLLAHASLKLLATLQTLERSEEVSDDLIESLKESKDSISEGLISLLQTSSGLSDENHKPLMVTNELLGRLVSQLPSKSLKDADDLFPLLYAPSLAVQGAAFDLLHKHIPAAQEQVSFDAALEDKTAHLPDELLSLIMNAPTLDTLADASFADAMPLQLQGFLNSWRILFDHFNGSSYRVKSDYVEQLKDGGYLIGLLDLTFDFLQLTTGRPVDASKFNVAEYTPRQEQHVETDVQWLLTHLYFLALSYLPSLVKAYVLDLRSRTVPQAIEKWTAKHISPLITVSSLKDVADWAEKSVKDDPDYENMTVKVGLRSKEINVGYMVDEQTMAIKVTLPDAYPLDAARVTSVNRVAVKEEKWQSWLRNCQGVITFSVSSHISHVPFGTTDMLDRMEASPTP